MVPRGRNDRGCRPVASGRNEPFHPTPTEEAIVPFTPEELAYLTDQPLGRIATASTKGTPDVAPVGFEVTADGTIVVGGLDNPKTLKWRNVVATGTAAFVVDDLASRDPWRPRGVKVRGTAVADDSVGRGVIRITPEVIWSWALNPDADAHFAGMIERREVERPS
jgi:pyridoxamine 5'-phosphate oxidase family protein